MKIRPVTAFPFNRRELSKDDLYGARELPRDFISIPVASLAPAAKKFSALPDYLADAAVHSQSSTVYLRRFNLHLKSKTLESLAGFRRPALTPSRSTIFCAAALRWESWM